MITIPFGTRFVDMPWYAANLDLTGNYPWKGNVTKIQFTRANGLGFDSNTTAAFASLKTLVTGKSYLLDLKNIPAGGLQIDNGTAPVAGSGSDTLELDIPAATTSLVETFDLDTYGFSFGPPVFKDALGNVLTGNGVGAVSWQLDKSGALTLDAFNAAMEAIPEAEIKAGLHTFTLTRSLASNQAGSVSIPVY